LLGFAKSSPESKENNTPNENALKVNGKQCF
jgi:hypothetical protein